MRRTGALVTAAVLTLAACGGTSSDVHIGKSDNAGSTVPGTGPRPTVPDGDDPFGWAPFGGDDSRLETGSLQVPIDYDDPAKGTFDLYVARHLADPAKRIGTLLVNIGGPGFGSTDLALAAEQIYGRDLLESFDILGWDPRGTGLSEPAIDCVDDYDRYFADEDAGLSDAEARAQEVALAKEFEQACIDKNREFYQYVGTNNSARDMNAIREALGEETISYFGFSYGSELGATWATLYPDTVRAAVLDGAADPNADATESNLQQSRGFEASFERFLDQCSQKPSCPFHSNGDARGAYEKLIDSLDERPVPTTKGRPDVSASIAVTAVAQAMYDQSYWDFLAQALADARNGDGEGLLTLYDAYYQRRPDGTYDNSLEAFQVISCMDTPERQTVEEADAEVPKFREAAPLLYGDVTTGDYFCTFFPPAIDPRVEITGAGAGPILVVGTTGDPATPLASSKAMADTLEEGVLLTVVADQHTGYDVNACSKSTVGDYLVKLKVPPPGTRCG
jgi:pimeloyl-ACP methyl ester carboxylesterase